jgi:hypothetical protein
MEASTQEYRTQKDRYGYLMYDEYQNEKNEESLY